MPSAVKVPTIYSVTSPVCFAVLILGWQKEPEHPRGCSESSLDLLGFLRQAPKGRN
jgi:hypothetical protein